MSARVWILPAAILALALLAAAPSHRDLSNLDFEQGAPDSVPPGWVVRNALSRGYRVTTNANVAHGGRKSVLIADDNRSMGMRSGIISKKLDARPYRGRRIRVGAWLRFEPLTGLPGLGEAGLLVRVDREDDRIGFFTTTKDHPVRSTSWESRDLLADVETDADSITISAYLDQSGSAWVDDVSFTVIGRAGEGDQPPRPLTDRGLQNLVAFTRLLGYVRHFHPSNESAATDWGAFAISGVDEVEGARTPAELAQILDRLFRPIAPTMRVAIRAPSPLTAAMLRSPGTEPPFRTGWWHHGWGGGQAIGGYRLYYDVRPQVPARTASDSVASIGTEVKTDLGGGVWCSVPTVLYADAAGTLPRGKASTLQPRRPEGWFQTGNDRGTRLADVILFWNIAQHFYPYFDVVGTDWPAQLPVALRSAAADSNAAALEKTLLRLVAQLRDGHGSVYPEYSSLGPLPLAWAFVGDRLVVTRADSALAGRLHTGDEVIAISGRPVRAWVEEAEPLVSAATLQHKKYALAHELQGMPPSENVWLDLRAPTGATRRETVSRKNVTWLRPPRPDSITTLRPGIMYVDIDRITDADFARVLPQLAAARAVIFDLRGYPRRISTVVLAHLIDSAITCARWNVPVVTRPDRRDMAFDFSNWPVEPRKPRIKGRAVFLIDGSAISYAETYLGMVENYRLAELVGEPTAGTNGNICTTRLPSGFNVVFTGMKVLKHDQSRHHGVGIRPTVPVSPTIAGIAAGRDEQLEKALEIVSR